MPQRKWKRYGKRLHGLIPFKQLIFTIVRAMVPVPERIFRHLHFKGEFAVKVSPTESFKVRHWGYLIENRLFWQGLEGWERISLRLWTLLARRSSVIFDIGANTGIYSLIAGSVNSRARIVAVEPIARVYEKLLYNIELNGSRITPVNVAMSDHDGKAPIYDHPDSEHVLAVSLRPDWHQQHVRTRAIEIDVRTIPTVMQDLALDHVDLLKIDVEGHELNVLKGSRSIIERDRPAMLLELLSRETAEEIAALLVNVDYVFYSIDEKTWPPVQIDRLEKSRYYNVLICVPEVAREIGLPVRDPEHQAIRPA